MLDDPARNTVEYLETKATELMGMTLKALEELGKQGREKREKEEADAIREIHRKHQC